MSQESDLACYMEDEDEGEELPLEDALEQVMFAYYMMDSECHWFGFFSKPRSLLGEGEALPDGGDSLLEVIQSLPEEEQNIRGVATHLAPDCECRRCVAMTLHAGDHITREQLLEVCQMVAKECEKKRHGEDAEEPTQQQNNNFNADEDKENLRQD